MIKKCRENKRMARNAIPDEFRRDMKNTISDVETLSLLMTMNAAIEGIDEKDAFDLAVEIYRQTKEIAITVEVKKECFSMFHSVAFVEKYGFIQD